VKEEEGDMFVQAKKAKVDTKTLGAKMLKRKVALMSELEISVDPDQAAASKKPDARRSA
jgi:hypothetical protein